jgi:hypothetical protein
MRLGAAGALRVSRVRPLAAVAGLGRCLFVARLKIQLEIAPTTRGLLAIIAQHTVNSFLAQLSLYQSVVGSRYHAPVRLIYI